MIGHQIWVFTCFNRNFQTIQTNSCGKCWLKPGFTTEFQTGLGGRGGAGAVVAFPVLFFLAVWDILEIHGSFHLWHLQNLGIQICWISVIFLQILSKFITETSGYHQYIMDIQWYLMWVTSMKFKTSSDVLHQDVDMPWVASEETFRGMMVASSRPWFDKANGYRWPIGSHKQQKPKNMEQRNNMFDRPSTTKSQLIFWSFSPNFDHF